MRRLAPIIGLILAVPVCARAQQPGSAPTPASFWASGMSIGVPGAGNQSEGQLFTVGGNFTRIQSGPGPDVSLFTIPRVFEEGIVPAIGRLGLALPIGMGPEAYLVPSLGIVVATILGPGGTGGTAGGYAGAALLALGPTGGVRVAYTLHRFDIDASVWHLEIGVVGRVGRGK